MVPFIGITLLGLAGAYLLRALTELHALPLQVGVGLGIVYALGWLVLAARTAVENEVLAVLRTVTSVLILMPLLWEAAVRFQALPSWLTASVLAAFTTAGLVVSWKKNRSAIAWITSVAGLLSLATLLVATRDLIPFTFALLGVAVVVEASATFDHWLGERWPVAVVADLALVLVAYIATRAGGIPEGYVPLTAAAVIAAQVALLGIYFLATLAHTLWRGRNISVFEVAQSIAAFLISTLGAVRVAQGHPAVVAAVGGFSLVCGIGCYLVSFRFLARQASRDRNFYSYATFGLALSVIGVSLLFHGAALAALLSVAGVLFTRVGVRAQRLTLEWHGLVYLVFAALHAGVVVNLLTIFLGLPSQGLGWPPAAAWIVGLGAVAAAGVVLGGSRQADRSGSEQAAGAAVVAAGVWGVVNLAGSAAMAAWPAAGFTPTTLTAILAVASIAAVLLGAWRLLPELSWVMYLFMGLATAKLMLQEMRIGHTMSIVISLLIYGGTLVLLPRLSRARTGEPLRS
jgi:hypothetical protein